MGVSRLGPSPGRRLVGASRGRAPKVRFAPPNSASVGCADAVPPLCDRLCDRPIPDSPIGRSARRREREGPADPCPSASAPGPPPEDRAPRSSRCSTGWCWRPRALPAQERMGLVPGLPARPFRWHRELVRKKWTYKRRGRPGRPPIDLGTAHPLAKRLGRDAEHGGDRCDGEPLRGMLVPVLEHHPDRPLAQLLRVPASSCQGSNLSRVEPPRKPERFMFPAPIVCVSPTSRAEDGLGRESVSSWRRRLGPRGRDEKTDSPSRSERLEQLPSADRAGGEEGQSIATTEGKDGTALTREVRMTSRDDRSEVSVVGRRTRIEGTVTAAGALRVEGEVVGAITAEGDVSLALRAGWRPTSRRGASPWRAGSRATSPLRRMSPSRPRANLTETSGPATWPWAGLSTATSSSREKSSSAPGPG